MNSELKKYVVSSNALIKICNFEECCEFFEEQIRPKVSVFETEEEAYLYFKELSENEFSTANIHHSIQPFRKYVKFLNIKTNEIFYDFESDFSNNCNFKGLPHSTRAKDEEILKKRFKHIDKENNILYDLPEITEDKISGKKQKTIRMFLTNRNLFFSNRSFSGEKKKELYKKRIFVKDVITINALEYDIYKEINDSFHLYKKLICEKIFESNKFVLVIFNKYKKIYKDALEFAKDTFLLKEKKTILL